jgi:hypothetical protein
MWIRRYALPLVLMTLAVACVLGGLFSLRIAIAIALNAGHAPVAHLQAFGRPIDRDELLLAWRQEERFRFAGWGLLAASLPFAVYAGFRFRRARVKSNSPHHPSE